MNGLGYDFTDNVNPFGMRTHTLAGGTATNAFRFATATNNTAVVDGSFAIGFSANVSLANITTNNTGVINFQDTWTGSWTRDNYAAADWQTIFTRTGMQFEGTQITAASFSTIFELTNAGAAGSTVRLLNPVPEPASVLGLTAVVSGAAAVWRRRRADRATPTDG